MRPFTTERCAVRDKPHTAPTPPTPRSNPWSPPLPSSYPRRGTRDNSPSRTFPGLKAPWYWVHLSARAHNNGSINGATIPELMRTRTKTWRAGADGGWERGTYVRAHTHPSSTSRAWENGGGVLLSSFAFVPPIFCQLFTQLPPQSELPQTRRGKSGARLLRTPPLYWH